MRRLEKITQKALAIQATTQTIEKLVLAMKTTYSTYHRTSSRYTRPWYATLVRLAVVQPTAVITTVHAREVLARGGLDCGQNYTVSDFCMTSPILDKPPLLMPRSFKTKPRTCESVKFSWKNYLFWKKIAYYSHTVSFQTKLVKLFLEKLFVFEKKNTAYHAHTVSFQSKLVISCFENGLYYS